MRWCAAGMTLTEAGLRTVNGIKDLWMLQAALDTLAEAKTR